MAIALYASHKCESKDSQPIRVGKTVVWIRVEDFGLNFDVSEALDKAMMNTIGSEMVLNAIEKTVCKYGRD
jgi:hypothetical protein